MRYSPPVELADDDCASLASMTRKASVPLELKQLHRNSSTRGSR